MTTTTWHYKTGPKSGIRFLHYSDPARELAANVWAADTVVAADSGYDWTVFQWGRLLAQGNEATRAAAKAAAQQWLDTCTEHTPA